MLKRSRWTFTAIVLVMSLVIVSAAPALELKFGDALPKTFSYYPAMLEFKKIVEERTKGEVQIKVFTDGVLGDQKTLLESTKVGAVDITVVASQISQQLVPEHGVFGLPFVWLKDEDYVTFLQSPVVQELGKKMQAHGLTVLSFSYGGALAVLNSKRDVRTPEDMKGLKLRVMQDPMQIDMIKAMGGIPVPMGTGELYSAIQQGQIDGNATSPQLLFALKNHEVAKHLTFTQHGRSTAVVLMNLKKWNGLSAPQRAALDEGAKHFGRVVNEWVMTRPGTNNREVVDMMRKAGVVVVDPDVAAFRKTTRNVVEEFRARVKSPLVDQVLKEAGY
jgi:tripartite ATP-independent transporter DctP family solute receptor